MVDAPNLPEAEASYVINADGIGDYKVGLMQRIRVGLASDARLAGALLTEFGPAVCCPPSAGLSVHVT